jgi:hypothetical protein
VLALAALRNSVWLALVAVIVLPRLVDALRPAVVEPARLNRLLAVAMLAGVVVATAGVAAKSVSWFTGDFPARAAGAATRAAGPSGLVFANERYADWLIWSDPALSGRVAFDSRFELLSRRQLRAVVEFRNRVGSWRSIVRGYSVLVLDKQDEGKVKTALVHSGSAATVRTEGDVIVLQTG